MTAKRFVYYEHKGADYILDTPNTELDFIEMLGDTLEAEEIVDKLNELAEENEQLKYSLSAHMIDLNNYKGKCSALEIESERLKQEVREYIKALNKTLEEREELWEENEQLKQLIKELEKQIYLVHMSSMFSTVKSFKGDVSKRYKYSEETDTIYDTANNYGQYDKVLDKKEIVMLLNEYETVLNELKGDVE